MKLIETKNAVGHVLCHDLTRIVPGEFKGAQFRKGHVVTQEDIPMLLSMGKEHLYVWEMEPGMLHENDAAERLCRICKNEHMTRGEVKEGKIELKADCDGLFRVNVEKLDAINMIDELMIATRHSNTPVHQGDKICGTRVIPLIIKEEKLNAADKVAGDTPILELLPYKLKTAAVITTGSEVASGRIQDTFTPILEKKLATYGISMTEHMTVGDGLENVAQAIAAMREKKTDIILCTGGMSVDPDDNTPGAIKKSGANIISYGAPVLPGAMFLLGYFEDGQPILGLPGCVMYAKATVFDLLMPRIAAISTFFIFFAGIFAAYYIAKLPRLIKGVLDVILTLPLVLPPTVVGYLLLRVLGPKRLIGAWILETFGVKMVMTWWSAIFATIVVIFPLMYRTVRGAFEAFDETLAYSGQTLGLSNIYIFWHIRLPYCRQDILAGTVLAFARALGEYGATSMIAGYTPGKTATISTTVYQMWRTDNDALAFKWVMVNAAISAVVLLAVNMLERKNGRARKERD